ncbi:MAG: DUF4097 family beta strand repeat-containing protein [Myxococcota bacterium]
MRHHSDRAARENEAHRPGFGGLLRSFFWNIPWHESASRDETLRVPSPPGGAISIHNANGGTRVVGEDRDDIEIRVHKSASADCPEMTQKLLDSIRLQKSKSGDILEIEVQIPRKCSRRAIAHIELRVPRATKVASTSTNGKISLEGLHRSIRARSSNGSISIFEVNGDIDVTTANAKVACRCTQGRLHARSSNGKIEVGGHTGSIDASTSNGIIKASIDSLGDEGVSLSTSNGRIVLDLPEGSDADVDIRVENGHIRNDIDLEDSSADSTGRVRGRIGKGGTPIRLRTSNGTVSLR